ncbi:CUB domain protein, partial [Ancylostoma duodenale]
QGACLNPTTTTAPVPVTLAPPTCDAPNFLDKEGTTFFFRKIQILSMSTFQFYSPGYPASYSKPKTCIYVMTVNPGDVVEIHFVDLQLIPGSSIQLFNTFADQNPFETITTDIPSSKYFASTTNVMKMAFVAANDKAGVNRWEAEFSSKNKGLLFDYRRFDILA